MKNSNFTYKSDITTLLNRVTSIKKKIEKKLETKYRLTVQRISELTLLRFKLLLEIDRLNKILHPVITTTQEILDLRESLKYCEDDKSTIEWKKKRIKKLDSQSIKSASLPCKVLNVKAYRLF